MKACFCKTCLRGFYSKHKLIDLETYCGEHKPTKIMLPKLHENVLMFKNYNRSPKIPFAVYPDFEYMLQKINTCQPSDETSYTNAN